ncbi:MAG TPA: alpha/beta hydrolase [Burkholderiaceae bacterium]
MTVSDLRGLSRMTFDAIAGVADLAQALQLEIVDRVAGRAGPLKKPVVLGTNLVYGGVRGVSRTIGRGLDAGLAKVAPLLGARSNWPGREAALAVLNGVLGDYLYESGNPLAVPMRWRSNGVPLAIETGALGAAFPDASGHLLVYLHGLCMNDLELRRNGHDHAQELAQEFGCTAIHLHYNTGRHISHNGRELAAQLQSLVAKWPVPVQRIDLLGHSMGGLLARSACHHADEARLPWRGQLGKLITLGTPHHGAPLERGGSWLRHLIDRSALTAPFARLVKARSAGITDLGFGNVRDSDWEGQEYTAPSDRRAPLSLPKGVECYAIGASVVRLGAATREALAGTLGDGLVPLGSALGQHPDPEKDLHFPLARQAVVPAIHHLDLLDNQAVYAQLRAWLAKRESAIIDV